MTLLMPLMSKQKNEPSLFYAEPSDPEIPQGAVVSYRPGGRPPRQHTDIRPGPERPQSQKAAQDCAVFATESRPNQRCSVGEWLFPFVEWEFAVVAVGGAFAQQFCPRNPHTPTFVPEQPDSHYSSCGCALSFGYPARSSSWAYQLHPPGCRQLALLRPAKQYTDYRQRPRHLRNGDDQRNVGQPNRRRRAAQRAVCERPTQPSCQDGHFDGKDSA